MANKLASIAYVDGKVASAGGKLIDSAPSDVKASNIADLVVGMPYGISNIPSGRYYKTAYTAEKDNWMKPFYYGLIAYRYDVSTGSSYAYPEVIGFFPMMHNKAESTTRGFSSCLTNSPANISGGASFSSSSYYKNHLKAVHANLMPYVKQCWDCLSGGGSTTSVYHSGGGYNMGSIGGHYHGWRGAAGSVSFKWRDIDPSLGGSGATSSSTYLGFGCTPDISGIEYSGGSVAVSLSSVTYLSGDEPTTYDVYTAVWEEPEERDILDDNGNVILDPCTGLPLKEIVMVEKTSEYVEEHQENPLAEIEI